MSIFKLPIVIVFIFIFVFEIPIIIIIVFFFELPIIPIIIIIVFIFIFVVFVFFFFFARTFKCHRFSKQRSERSVRDPRFGRNSRMLLWLDLWAARAKPCGEATPEGTGRSLGNWHFRFQFLPVNGELLTEATSCFIHNIARRPSTVTQTMHRGRVDIQDVHVLREVAQNGNGKKQVPHTPRSHLWDTEKRFCMHGAAEQAAAAF
eukprot:GHVO01064083.1.p1 GENE.GHVO01064083.1~~GHVO01064083.1.p1  ORF type:complete len:205 (-),score=10.36 GHVO01064083.1:11-625(-)